MTWMHSVAQWPLWLVVAAIFAISIGASWGLVRLVRRLVPYPISKENNELVGFTYAVLGVIYGVLLAFTIIVAWERFAETERIVLSEVTVLSQLWRDAKAFPPAVSEKIHDRLLVYAQSVVEDEWPEMGVRGRSHPKTNYCYEQLWECTYTIEPTTKLQEAFLTEVLSDINQLSANRRLRILHSRMAVNGVLWLVLFVGAVPTIGFPLLLTNKHVWVHVVITLSVMLVVLLSLLVVLSLQYPFTGDVCIQPESFQSLIESFQQRMLPHGIHD